MFFHVQRSVGRETPGIKLSLLFLAPLSLPYKRTSVILLPWTVSFTLISLNLPTNLQTVIPGLTSSLPGNQQAGVRQVEQHTKQLTLIIHLILNIQQLTINEQQLIINIQLIINVQQLIINIQQLVTSRRLRTYKEDQQDFCDSSK